MPSLCVPRSVPALAWCWQRLGWRRLLPQEIEVLRAWLGEEQAQWCAQHATLGVRRWGDTRRAACLWGAWVSLPRACFIDGRGDQLLRLSQPVVAGVLAHELLHALQRRAGLAVTRQAAWLQCRALCGGDDPYAYPRTHSARALLRFFWQATVEQQGQMWQDWVQALVAGQPCLALRGVAAAVRAGRLRRR